MSSGLDVQLSRTAVSGDLRHHAAPAADPLATSRLHPWGWIPNHEEETGPTVVESARAMRGWRSLLTQRYGYAILRS